VRSAQADFAGAQVGLDASERPVDVDLAGAGHQHDVDVRRQVQRHRHRRERLAGEVAGVGAEAAADDRLVVARVDLDADVVDDPLLLLQAPRSVRIA
jgi:hypothetical protein